VISGVGGPSTINCPATPSFSSPTASDGCGAASVTFTDATTPGTCANNYTITRTFTATDACGNTATASQAITVVDNTPPTLSGVGGPSTINCPATPTFSSPTASDGCGAASVTFTDATTPGTCANNYTITRTFKATDACGNTATATQAITVVDNTPPTLSGVGGPSTINCPATPSFSSPTASDGCGAASVTFTDATTPGTCANNYTITRTFKATDACGNTATATQAITVVDNTPPTLSGVGGPSTINCPATPSFSSPTASDGCGAASVTFTDATTPGTCANNYTITRTFTATDACGNTATASQAITVVDNTPPTLSGVGGPSTINCPATPSFSSPTASDGCGAASVTFTDATTPGTCANNYTITRTFKATDACGNTATASQAITVVDNTPPTLSGVGGPSTINCPATPSFSSPTASDGCSAASVTFTDATTPGTCTNNYTITRTFKATDACGNTATASQAITVVDNTPPTLSGVGGPSTINCPATPSFSSPTASDGCSAASVTFTDATTPGTCANNYTITRTFKATDACGNTATATQAITVVDNTPPTLSGVGGPSTINCPATPTFSSPTASDGCGTASVTFTDATTPGTCANNYTITRTFKATDACGNTATATQAITVVDNTPPTLSGVGGPSTINCPATPSFSSPTASDGCGTASVTFTDATTPGTCANNYTITRTFTATDACGNTATASQAITVVDNTPPTLSGVGGPSSINCPATPSFSSPTASDACGAASVTFTDATTPGTCANNYTITRTFKATDACGNTATASQAITVVDNTPPTLSGVGGPSTINCPATPSFSSPTASDGCGAASVTFTDATTPGTCANNYTITRTFTATDACGNTATASQAITVVDNTPPTLSGVGGPSTINCPATPSFSSPTASDGCGAASVTFTDATTPGTCTNNYTITRTFKATDACGNTATASQAITVVDNTPPTLSGVGGPSTINCPATPSFSSPTASDGCGAASVTFTDATTPGTCANNYTITRTFKATDACGNTATATQAITVVDNTPPTLSGVGGPSTINCPATPSFSSPTASDACGAASVTFTDATTPGTCANNYTITRTFTATDACGNTATATQAITVVDNTPPTLSGVGGPSTINCPATPSFSSPTASDGCGAASVTFTDATTPGTCANNYTITRTFKATDACGNTATATQAITVVDNTPPVISGVGGPSTINCPATPSFSSPTASDGCGAASVTFTDATTPGTCANNYTITRTFTATDACGNTATATQAITVVDNAPPTLSGVGGPFNN
jgi:hypothetical protein